MISRQMVPVFILHLMMDQAHLLLGLSQCRLQLRLARVGCETGRQHRGWFYPGLPADPLPPAPLRGDRIADPASPGQPHAILQIRSYLLYAMCQKQTCRSGVGGRSLENILPCWSP